MSVRLPRSRRLVAALTLSTAVAACLVTHSASAAPPTYQNPRAAADSRAVDLVNRMSLGEQIGQLVQIQVGHLYGDCSGYNPGPLNESCAHQVLATDAVGSILSGGGDVPGQGHYPNTPAVWAEQVNTMTKYSIEHSRLHIPIVYGADVVHGHNDVLGTTLFPHQIGLGSSFDPALVKAVQTSAGRASAATNVRWAFAPVADVNTNSRWGRYYEPFGEDAVLNGALAASAVQGLQHNPSVAATVKHFAPYGASNDGRDRTPADLSLRNFETNQLPSYAQAIAAHPLSVMVNSASVNGIPATGSKYLLTTVLRKQLGFDGVTISDWADVAALLTSYHAVGDYEHAIAMAINAGVDVTMEPYDADSFVTNLTAAVRDKLVSKSRIREAATRVLTMKFRLGLFDHPYVSVAQANKILGADTDLARRAAVESSVLLRNENKTLPLSPSAKLVVTGPAADSVADTLGGWSIGWQGVPDGSTEKAVTVAAGLKNAGGANVTYVAEQSAAVQAAANADAVVAVLGRGPGAETANDTSDPTLPADQQAMVAALQKTGKPVIVVLIDDRPDALGDASTANAILAAWRPGTEGGNGVADLLYGKANPSGKLSVSWPKDAHEQPNSYRYGSLPATNGGPNGTYAPAYPFGFGLSYSQTSASVSRVVAHGNTVSVRLTVANTSGPSADLVVPVFVSQPVSPVLVPSKRLVGFSRVTGLAAGTSRTITVAVPTSRLQVVGGDIDGTRMTLESGKYVFSTGTAGPAETATGINTVTF